MQRNLLHYQRALFLRKKKGYSYNEIREEIPVPKSTLSNWLSEIELTKKQQHRIHKNWLDKVRKHNKKHNLGEWNRKKRQKEITAIRVQAKKEVNTMTPDQLFIAGIMLYWAEGAKGGKDVQISNADPLFILFIMHWFRKSLCISEDQFKASIHYHEGQNEDEINKYWSKLTGIPLIQFNRSFKKPPGTGHRTHYLQWGVLRIRIRCSANLFHKISGWKDGLIEQHISGITN